MINLAIPASSKEYIRVRVTAKKDGVAYDPTSDPVDFAFTSSEDDDQAVWSSGSWETESGSYYARYLMPGTMSEGGYIVWVRITDAPEVPVRKIGRITLF